MNKKTLHQITDLDRRIKDNGGINSVSQGCDVHKESIYHLKNGTGNPTRESVNRLRAYFGLVKLN